MKTGKKKKKPAPNVAAVIEFSSNNLRMVVGERAETGIRSLEFLEYPLAMGKDTFATGKLSFDKVNRACVIINNFLNLAAGYGVESDHVRVIATSALREAVNKSYALDQIRLKTGMNVEILDSQEEKLQIFKMALRLVDREAQGSALLVYVGSGNVGYSLIQEGKISFYQSVRIGPLRISELFEDIANKSGEYHIVVEEYIKTFINLKETLRSADVKRLILTGGDVNLIKDLCGAEKAGECFVIKKEAFDGVYGYVKSAPSRALVKEFTIPPYRADMLLPAMSICGHFLGYTGVGEALAPPAYLNEAVLYGVLFPEEAVKSSKDFYRNSVLCAKEIAGRYNASERHAETVESFAIKIFDKIRKLHGMGALERTLLQCAAYLHDIGKFVNVRDHALHSFNIVKGLDIIGFNQKDLDILALICLLHSSAPPEDMRALARMPEADAPVTSKLAAILRLADSLDRSGEQTITDIEAAFEDDDLMIHAQAKGNIDLEKWSFGVKNEFFSEVFGIRAVIRAKTRI